MVKNYFRLFVFLLLTGCAASCTKKGDTGPAGPAGPSGTSSTSGVGEIYGHVSLYDQYGSRLYTGLNNVKLTLKNGNYTSADVTGYYTFPALASEGYTVSASATSYGATQFTMNVLGDTVYKDVKLSAIPGFQVLTFKAYHNTGSPNDSLILTFNSDTRVRNCLVLVSSQNTVSNLPGNYILAYTKAIPAWATQVMMQIPVSDLNGANIFFGQEVYYAAYSYVVNDASVYEDQATGRNAYNAVGTPLVDSTTSP